MLMELGGDIEQRFLEGARHLEAAEWNKALHAFREVVAEDEADAAAFYGGGRTHWELGAPQTRGVRSIRRWPSGLAGGAPQKRCGRCGAADAFGLCDYSTKASGRSRSKLVGLIAGTWRPLV